MTATPTARELTILQQMVSDARLDGRNILALMRPAAIDGEVLMGLPGRSGDLGIIIGG